MKRMLKVLGSLVVAFAIFVVAVAILGGNRSGSPNSATTTQAPAQQVVAANPETVYLESASAIATTMAQSMSQLSNLMLEPRFGQTEWTVDVAAQFATWTASYRDAQALTPPESLRETHDLFLASLAQYDRAGEEMARAIDAGDPDAIYAALDIAIDANALMEQATATLPQSET